MNWEIVLNNYPLPEELPNSYLEIIKQEIRGHINNDGTAKDERSKALFSKFCRIVDTFNGKKIEWNKTAEEYLKERETMTKKNGRKSCRATVTHYFVS